MLKPYLLAFCVTVFLTSPQKTMGAFWPASNSIWEIYGTMPSLGSAGGPCPVAAKYQPQQLHWQAAGLFFGFEEISWSAGELEATRRMADPQAVPQEKKSRSCPTDEQWKAFWHTVEQLGVWQWKHRYEPPPNKWTPDGITWSMKLEYRDKKLECSGYDLYPMKYGDFYKALRQLFTHESQRP